MTPGIGHMHYERGARARGFTLVELVVVIGIIILLVAITAAVSTSLVSRSEVNQTESTLNLLTVALDDYRLSTDREITLGVDDTPAGAVYDLHPDTPHVATVCELLAVIGRTPTAKSALAQIPDEQVHRFSSSGTGTPQWLVPGDPDDPDPNAGSWTLADFGDLATRHPSAEILVILDAWDTPIRLIHPGRQRNALVPAGLPGDPAPATWPAWTRDGNGNVREDDGTIFVDDTGTNNGLEEYYGLARNRKICFVSAGPDRKFGNVSADLDSDEYKQSLDNIYSYEVIRP